MAHRFAVGDRVRHHPGDYPATIIELVGEDAYRLTWDDGFTEDESEEDANIWRDHELVAFDHP